MDKATDRFQKALNKILDSHGFEERGRAPYLQKIFRVSQPAARDWLLGISLPGKSKWEKFKSTLGMNIAKIISEEETLNCDALELNIITPKELSSKIDYDFIETRSQIDYCPPQFKLGKDTILYFKKIQISDTYQIYELLVSNKKIRTMRKTRTDGLDTYLVPDGQGKEYCLSEYENEFIGSLVGIKIL